MDLFFKVIVLLTKRFSSYMLLFTIRDGQILVDPFFLTGGSCPEGGAGERALQEGRGEI